MEHWPAPVVAPRVRFERSFRAVSQWMKTIGWSMASGDRSAHAGVAISTVLHLFAIAALGFWLMGDPSAAPAIVLTTNWSADSTNPIALNQEPANLDQVQSESGGASFGTISFVPSLATSSADVVTDVELHFPDAIATSLADVDLAEPVRPLTGLGLEAALGAGAGFGNGAGDGTGTDFFGLTAPGQKFVFVVDASGSMNRPFPGPGKTLLGRVKLELLKCVTQMSPEQQFFIVFFNDEAYPMPADRLINATPESQRRYLWWMAEMKAGGMTEPETALLLALQLNPDVVYFLTDGAFKYRVIGRVQEMNRRGTTIHTVGFGDRTGFGEDGAERFMRMIADQNGGTYQFVSADAADQPVESGTDGGEQETSAENDVAEQAQVEPSAEVQER